MSNFPDDLISLGKVVKPHGVKGLIKFKPYNQNSSILSKDMIVWFSKENNDLVINVLDIIETINFILNNDYNEIVDMNYDGRVDVLDIVQLVNIILGRLE